MAVVIKEAALMIVSGDTCIVFIALHLKFLDGKMLVNATTCAVQTGADAAEIY